MRIKSSALLYAFACLKVITYNAIGQKTKTKQHLDSEAAPLLNYPSLVFLFISCLLNVGVPYPLTPAT